MLLTAGALARRRSGSRDGAAFKISNLKMQSTSGDLVSIGASGRITTGAGLDFGATSGNHVRFDLNGQLAATYGTTWTVSGNAAYHIWGKDTRLSETIANGQVILAGSVIGAYVFGAVWDDRNIMAMSRGGGDSASRSRPRMIHQDFAG